MKKKDEKLVEDLLEAIDNETYDDLLEKYDCDVWDIVERLLGIIDKLAEIEYMYNNLKN